jgi:hypothetical protein
MEFQEKVDSAVRGLLERFEKIGLVPLAADLALSVDPTQPPIEPTSEIVQQRFESGESRLVAQVVLRPTHVAFTERVLDPEAHEMTQAFRKELPTEEEVGIDMMVEELSSWDEDL